jgi:hypothetical protein
VGIKVWENFIVLRFLSGYKLSVFQNPVGFETALTAKPVSRPAVREQPPVLEHFPKLRYGGKHP